MVLQIFGSRCGILETKGLKPYIFEVINKSPTLKRFAKDSSLILAAYILFPSHNTSRNAAISNFNCLDTHPLWYQSKYKL